MNALLIPIYEPTDKVLPFLSQFQKGDFDVFLVVDDGSGDDYAAIFAEAKEKTVFPVLSYPTNKGKGHALKTGLRKLLSDHPDLDFVVTADGDGQHTREDILKVRDFAAKTPSKVILGSRDFSSAPPKSASGNKWSARYFTLSTGVKIRDCQTGLRAIPHEAFDMALHTYGNRFDFEMNFLLPASREFGILEVPIQTIYEDGNRGTHFRPVADSLLIMRTPIAYLIVGLLSFATDMIAFYLLQRFAFVNAASVGMDLLLSYLCAMAISAPFNYAMLGTVVFHHSRLFHNALYKFVVLVLTCTLSSFFFTWTLSLIGVPIMLSKAIFDVMFGITKYFLNLLLVFANRKFGNKKELH